MILVSSCSCLCPIHWSQVLSRGWRCSWSSTDRWCSNYIWVINRLVAYQGAPYIRGLTAQLMVMDLHNLAPWPQHPKLLLLPSPHPATQDHPESKVHGANMGPRGPRWAPCWPHELCYLGNNCHKRSWYRWHVELPVPGSAFADDWSGTKPTLKRKCRHFDEIFITGCSESCHFDNFQCSSSKWRHFRFSAGPLNDKRPVGLYSFAADSNCDK